LRMVSWRQAWSPPGFSFTHCRKSQNSHCISGAHTLMSSVTRQSGNCQQLITPASTESHRSIGRSR
jgi:hypothetical protein